VSSNKNNEIEEKKDVFYRAKKNPKINWRSALWAFAKQFLIELANIISFIFEGADELMVLEHLIESDETNNLLQTLLSNFKSTA
jgi:hypothetical protein